MNHEGNSLFQTLKRFLVAGCWISLFVSAAVILRLSIVSHNYWFQGAASEQLGHLEEAFSTYTWSIRNYYPGNSYSYRALEGALRIIDHYHEDGKMEQEKQALLDLRAVLLSIRSFYQPNDEQLQRIETKLFDDHTLHAESQP